MRRENLPADLLQLVAYCVSISAGCRYRQAHAGHNTERMSNAGCPSRKRSQVLNLNAACFSDAERAVIALALPPAKCPTGRRKLILMPWASTSRHVKLLKLSR